MFSVFYAIIAIERGFRCIDIRQVPWEVLKTAASGLGFQHLPRDLANVNAWKTMFDPYNIAAERDRKWVEWLFQKLNFMLCPKPGEQLESSTPKDV